MLSPTARRSKRQKTAKNDNMSSFRAFGQLHSELKSHILTFVADAPFERDHFQRQSTLTHCLPLVCKEFHAFANHDDVWEQILLRRIEAEPSLWLEPTLRLAGVSTTSQDKPAPMQLIEQAKLTLGVSAKDLYKRIIDDFIRFRGPVFIMQAQIQIGEEYGLHLFEPRYRLLVAEVMRNQPETARQDGELDPLLPPAVFIHAHRVSPREGNAAMIVEIRRCLVYADGSADVLLAPLSYVWLEKLRIRPNSGNLFEGSAVRMTSAWSESMEREDATRGG
ncbi:hypothetical protein MPSEU_000886500 [Mayamaea pseudoterrestris]|nr:hypothetical protein MPSEU_000886500 [Mayamaea pseudoterrestris]